MEPRDPPDPDDGRAADDIDDYEDYAELRSGTFEQVVAGIRADLAAMPAAELAKIDLTSRKADGPPPTPAEIPEIADDQNPNAAHAPSAPPKQGPDPPE